MKLTAQPGIIGYLLKREHGFHNKCTFERNDDLSLRIGEDKATLPVKNQVSLQQKSNTSS